MVDISSPLLVAALAIGYFFGSVPFGLLVTRAAGLADIRSVGSGNIGATNVLRTGRKSLAAATLLGDMLKGTAAVLLVSALWGRDAGMAAGLAALLGHVFPVWLSFRGGKGVATYIGVLIALAWPIALLFGAIWIAAAFLTRYSSLSALVASAATPVALWFSSMPREAALFAGLTVLLWMMHRGNIARPARGQEGRIGARAAQVGDDRGA